MTLKERISADYIEAFKNRRNQVKNVLAVVKGEIQTTEKNLNVSDLSDEGVTKILTKMCKSLQETIDLTNDHESIVQIAVLREYMPKQMSREEIAEKIRMLQDESGPNILTIGMVMKAFAKDSADKKLVSEIYQKIVAA